MLLALRLSVSLLAVMASPGQARSLEVTLPADLEPIYSYGDMDYNYEGKSNVDRVNGEDGGRAKDPFDDPYDYGYSYGDPDFDYHDVDDRPAEASTKDPQLDEGGTTEVDLPSPSEGERDIEDDLANTPALPESDNDVEDDTSSVLRWIKNQWDTTLSQMERVALELRVVKESIESFLYRLGDTLKKGAEYCIQKLRMTAQDIDSRAKDALQKLEDQLRKDNALVIELFRLLGKKVREWSGQQESTLGTSQRNDVQVMPNFFKDEDVSEQLSLLVEDHVLTKEEKVILEMA